MKLDQKENLMVAEVERLSIGNQLILTDSISQLEAYLAKDDCPLVREALIDAQELFNNEQKILDLLQSLK